MKERPILFNGEMVRAILDGRKTQTRRLVSPAWPNHFEDPYFAKGCWFVCDNRPPDVLKSYGLRFPYGAVGDQLWVRETWFPGYTYGSEYPAVGYAADHMMLIGDKARPVRHVSSGMYGTPNDKGDGAVPAGAKFKPSVHMPRWASRIDLTITDIRVQRLQDITEDDARAEGVVSDDIAKVGVPCFSARAKFAKLWDTINGVRASWDDNPCVWAISFKRTKP